MKRKDYDDNLLVELLGRGEMTEENIAETVGISRSTVWRVANGLTRPELQSRIQAVVDGMLTEARRSGARWMRKLLARQISEGLEGQGETARKCREYVLNKLMDNTSDTPLQMQDQLPTPGLTAEDYRAIAELKGGPRDDVFSRDSG